MAQEEIIFPNNIRKIRFSIGMKMTELTRRTNLSLSAVSKIEKGVRRLNQNQLLNICNILGCKLSDIFIKESDEVADVWQNEIKRRLSTNEDGGLKIFGTGLRKIRVDSGKTIANAAKDAGMTLSVYHKIEIGQREVYEDEIEPLAKSFGMTTDEMLDKVAHLYKSGALASQINKVKERVKSVLIPGSPMSDVDASEGLYGVKLYNSARNKLVPVFGSPADGTIHFKKSDKNMIVAPADLEGSKSVYAVIPNTKRLGDILPKNSYVFADSAIKAQVGDMAVFLEQDFKSIDPNATINAHIGLVKKDSKGELYCNISSPAEKIRFKTIHKIVLIQMQ